MEKTELKHRSWDFFLYITADPFMSVSVGITIILPDCSGVFQTTGCNPLEHCEISVMGFEVNVMNYESIKKNQLGKKQNVSLHKERVFFQELLFQVGICEYFYSLVCNGKQF